MKYKYLFIFLVFSVFQLQAVEQKKVSYSFFWDGLQKISSPNSDIQVLHFESAIYSDSSHLPFFSTTLPFAEGQDVIVENVVFGNFTSQEKAYLAQYNSSVFADSLSVKKKITINRKQKQWLLRFFPIVRDSLGEMKKVISFDIRYKLSPLQKKLANTGIHQYVSSSVLASGKWVKIQVASTGIYKLTYNDLVSMGVSNPSAPRVFGYGGAMLPEDFSQSKIDDLPEVSIWVEKGTDGVFNAGDFILFYAQGPVSWTLPDGATTFVHTVNPYSKYGYYFVTSNVGEGESILPKVALTETPIEYVDYFLDYQLHENDEVNLVKSGREWYGEQFGSVSQRNFSFSCPNVYTSRSSFLTVDVAAESSIASSFSVFINGTLAGSNISIPKVSSDYEKAKAGNANYSFTPTDNTNIKLQYNLSNSSSQAWLNYLNINVYRQLKMDGSVLFFRNPEIVEADKYVRFVISTPPVGTVVWDITNPAKAIQMPTAWDGQQLTFIAKADSLKQYVALVPSATYSKPEVVGTIPNQNLHTLSNIDYVIIANSDFVLQANELAKAHLEKDNMSVVVVTPEQVYNEFSSGTPDATAYRWLMKMLYDKAATESQLPKYLLLFGDGSYDNRKITAGASQINRLLTYESVNSLVEADLIDNSYVCDDYFGFLDDIEGVDIKSETMDIGVGRFPVNTNEQATDVVNKSISYMKNDNKGAWKNQVCYIGDDEDSNLHMTQADTLASYTTKKSPQLQVTKIYLDAFYQEKNASGESYPLAKEKLLGMIKNGALLINYTGHGSTEGWAAEKLLTRSDIVNLYNQNLPLFVTATCDFSRFDDKTSSSGEELFWNPNGGGVALFSTSRTVYTGPNLELNKSFNNQVFALQDGKRKRLGDISRLTKNSRLGDNNKLNFMLIGDPALLLSYPISQVVTSDIAVDGLSTNTLQALSVVRVNGYIQTPSGQKLTDFNGVIHMTVFDKQQTVSTLANNGGTPFTYKDYPSAVFIGKDSVRNGDFSISFIVPKDIAYNLGKGRIVYYAADKTRDYEANGYYNDVFVGGSNSNFTMEENGPTINMYMNTPSFVSGNKVNENPVFIAHVSDDSGINATGNGIGHDILLSLDDDVNQTYVLNNYYQSNLGSYKSGMVTYSFENLAEGKHSLIFRVWDVLNNSSSKIIDFTVVKGLTPDLYMAFAVPNPAFTNTVLYVSHDRPLSLLEASVVICDLTGKTVWNTTKSIYAGGNVSEIVSWNLKDNNGKKVPPGVYIYRISLTAKDGQSIYKANKIVIK